MPTDHDWSRADAMSAAEVHDAAMGDPDAQPLTDAAVALLHPVPRSRTIRRALGLTAAEFAMRFQIPLGIVLGWEQGTQQPDPAAQAYLRAIAGNAAAVQQALQSSPAATA